MCVLLQLGDIDVVTTSATTKGRTITPNGQRDLDLIAGRIQHTAEDEEEIEEEEEA